MIAWLKFWQTKSWHYWLLRHEIDEFHDPDGFWDGMFSHECSCGMWWFA